MSRKKPFRIALYLPLAYSFARSIAQGVFEYVRERKGHQWNVSLNVSGSGYETAVEEICSFPFDACLALVRTPEMEERLRENVGFPVNISNQRLDLGLPQVVNDDLAVGRMAADFFIERGYQKFCYIWTAGMMGFSRLRYRGFAKRLWENGLTVDERFSVRKIRRMLDKIPHGSAIFVSDDQTAVPLCQLCDRRGLRLPEDFSILSVDNDELFCQAHAYNLSSIELDGERIGWEACQLIDRWSQGMQPPSEPVRVPPLEIVERRSTDHYAVENKRLRRALAIINRQLHTGINPDEVADQIGIQRRTLDKDFSSQFGHTTHDHIRRVQIQKAKKLLRSREASLEEIAAACGFRSLQTLRRNFHEQVGMSPMDYRGKHQLASSEIL